MKSKLLSFLEVHGIKFRVERNGKPAREFDGLFNHEKFTRRQYIGFVPKTDVKPGDWLINSSDERFYVEDIKTDYEMQQPFELKAYYLTEVEHGKLYPPAPEAEHEPEKSVDGAAESEYSDVSYGECVAKLREKIDGLDLADFGDLNASEAADERDALYQIADFIESVLKDESPLTEGILNDFSDVIQRNPWVTVYMSIAFLNWIVGN